MIKEGDNKRKIEINKTNRQIYFKIKFDSEIKRGYNTQKGSNINK